MRSGPAARRGSLEPKIKLSNIFRFLAGLSGPVSKSLFGGNRKKNFSYTQEMKFAEYLKRVSTSLFLKERSSRFSESTIRFEEIQCCIEKFDFKAFEFVADTPFAGECSICLDSFGQRSSVLITKCGHPFHSMCLVNCLVSKHAARSCPLCRTTREEMVSDGLEGAVFQFLEMIHTDVAMVERCHQAFLRNAQRRTSKLLILQKTPLASPCRRPPAAERPPGQGQSARGEGRTRSRRNDSEFDSEASCDAETSPFFCWLFKILSKGGSPQKRRAGRRPRALESASQPAT